MALARLYNFSNLTVRESAKMDAELNQIINFLKGSTTADQLYIVFSDPSAPPLTVGQLSNGNVITFQQNTTDKAYIDKDGILTNTLSTGTAPIVVASTTMCPNLNVGYLDGISTAFFNSNSLLGEYFTGSLQITKLSTGTQSVKFVQDADTFSVQRTSDSDNLFSIEDMELDEGAILTFPSDLQLQLAYEPDDTDYFDLLRLADLNDASLLEERNIVNGTRQGVLATNDIIMTYVSPCPMPNVIKLLQVNIILYAASGTTAQTVTIYKNGVSIGDIQTVTTNIVYSRSFSEVLEEDDLITAKITTTVPGTITISVEMLLTW